MYNCEYCSRVSMTLEEKNEHYLLHEADGIPIAGSISVPSEPMSQVQIETALLVDAKSFGSELILEFMAENRVMGIEADGETMNVFTLLSGVVNLMSIGALPAAATIIPTIVMPEVGSPTYKYVNPERISNFAARLDEYIEGSL